MISALRRSTRALRRDDFAWSVQGCVSLRGVDRDASKPPQALEWHGARRIDPAGAGGREEDAMTTYIMLMNWTDAGVKNVRESPARLDTARRTLGEMGGKFREFYLTMGDHDMIAICEAPSDAVIARFTLSMAAAGSVRTKTLKAFPEIAYRDIIGSLST